MIAQTKNQISPEDYAAIEAATGLKHEYYRGAVYAMTGASPRHNLIVANVIAALHAQLRGRPCAVYPSDQRGKIEQTGLYTYPDISVICGEPRLDSARRDTVTNPAVIIEVLSPSTKDYDRGTKFEHYRTIATLREHLVIAQDMPHIEHYVRQDSDQWLLIECRGTGQTLRLAAIGCALTTDDVYEKVTFPADSAEDGAAALRTLSPS